MLTRLVLTVLLGTVGLLSAGCGPADSPGLVGGKMQVVAAENFWGSLASQLGGSRAAVVSVVTDPNADPHEYESNAATARAFATARLVILNGAGYDDWAQKLLDANASGSRAVFSVASFLGKKAGDNPHFWYNPDFVLRVADKITAELSSIDPGDRAYFARQRSAFATALQPYLARLADIRARFAGTPAGATESIFEYLAAYLRLDLVSPPEFMRAISEGNDPAAADVARFHDQLARKQIKVLVYNVQTVTAVTTNLKQEAAQESIPVVGISETLQPVTATFQDWQLGQLDALERALASP